MGIAIILMASCASGPPAKLSVPAAASGPVWSFQVGPIIDLLPTTASEDDRVRTLVDSRSQVHVLIASAELKSLYDVRVGPDGVLERTLVQSGVPPSTIDGALDERGRLHVLLGFRHFLFDDTRWLESDQTPWARAHLKVERPHFVRGAPRLIWVFDVSGKNVGANWAWDWFGFGNAMGGLIWPWPSRGEKTVLVAEMATGEMNWTVLERDVKHDAIASCAASDRAGNVFVVYTKRRVILQTACDPRFVRIDAQAMGAAVPQSDAASGHKEGDFPLRSAVGEALPGDAYILYGGPDIEHFPRRIFFQSDCLAVDPDEGGALFGWRLLWRAGTWNATSEVRAFDAGKDYEWRAAAAGGGSFHGLFVYRRNNPGLFASVRDYPVTYGKLTGTAWSQTVDVGTASGSTIDVASTGPAKAFAVWPTQTGFVGRWIESTLQSQ